MYLLGSDDFSEADVPKDAFVVYQVGGREGGQGGCGWLRVSVGVGG